MDPITNTSTRIEPINEYYDTFNYISRLIKVIDKINNILFFIISNILFIRYLVQQQNILILYITIVHIYSI